MVRPITTTKVAQLKRAVSKSKELAVSLQEGYDSRDREIDDKVHEMLMHQMAYLRKVTAGFDSLELREKIQMLFVETAIELEKIGEIYLSLIEKGVTDLKKIFEKAGLIDIDNKKISLTLAC